MSRFRISMISGDVLVVDEVFMDFADGWPIFRELHSGGPERLRINPASLRYILKVQSGQDRDDEAGV